MKRKYFKYSLNGQDRVFFEKSKNNHVELGYFYMALYNNTDTGVFIMDYNGLIDVSFDGDFKSEIHADIFDDQEEEFAYWDAYQVYRDKRSSEMPRIITTEQNFEKAKQTIRQVHQDGYQYIMFSLRKEDGYDVVDIEGKHELSAQDLEYIDKEHDLCLLYEEAERLCERDTMSIYDDRWRSPKDSVFNADIEKYLGRTTCLYGGDRTWSKAEIIEHVLKQLKEGVQTYLIAHSIARHYMWNIVDPDEHFKKIMEYFYFKDLDLEKTSRKELQDIFDRLSLGQDVVLPDSTDVEC